MAISVVVHGNQALTAGGTEDVLYTNTNPGVFVPNISLANMLLGDVVRIRIYKYDDASALVMAFDAEYKHVQGAAWKQCPMIDAPYGMKFTVTQSAGSSRNCRYFLSQLDA